MEDSGKYVFEKLTPVSDANIDVYESALDFVFQDKDIRNVAISGAYGAGKSSLLASYKQKHSDTHFVHISLAHFQNQDKNANLGDPTPVIKESVLEGKILNQLIHQIPADKIPQTNFRVKKSSSSWNPFWYTLAIGILLLAIFHILFFPEWGQYVSSLPKGKIHTFLGFSTGIFSRLISGILCFSIVLCFLFQVIKTQKNKNIFRKLSIQGNEIEIFEESEDSYFDKYLNEVLYLFENVDADVIVFEDMDRFDANRIFERLREVNTLVNLRRLKENKEVLRFFYLLRDDIFVSKDRTKFFDYIIPVVPVVDSSNSYNQFISHLKKNDLFSKFDESFLQGLSLYVDDMRLLKNICNEFLVYYNRLNTTELDYNKMLAIITYKNLFPRDFSDLQLNKGFVFSIFANKDQLIKKQNSDLQTKIDEKKQRIANAQSEVANSQKELEYIFDSRRRAYGYYTNRLNSSDQKEHDRRQQTIKDKSDSVIQALEEEISNYEVQIEQLSNAPLASIITRDNIDSIFSLNTINEVGVENNYYEIKSSDYFDLVKYLIRNGYIDETYADYMTYFYEDSLSRVDKIFLRSVTDRRAKPYSFELKDPEKVVRRLRPKDFDQEETLNLKLCDYLLGNEGCFPYLQRLVEQLQNTHNYDFVAQLFDYTKHEPSFIRTFNTQWPSLFGEIRKAEKMCDKQIKRYSVLSLYYSSKDSLNAINSNAEFSSYIANSATYLDISNPQVDKLIDGFELLGILFPSIEYESANKELLFAVYQNDLYVLNFENLELVLEKIIGVSNAEDIRHKSYTIITSDSTTPLYKRIEKNFSAFMDIILEECNEIILDNEDTATDVLNRTDITLSQKQEYIQYLQTAIHSLKYLTDQSIWEALLQSGVLLCSEEDIMDYFHYKGELDGSLVDYINRSSKRLDFSEKSTGFSKEQRESLFNKMVKCNGLANTQYSQMIETLGFYYEKFNIPDIQESKMIILIDSKIIRMNAETLGFVREEYPKVLYHFIKKYLDEYIGMMTDDLFVQSELIEILEWDIPDSLKLSLLKFSSVPISIVEHSYSTSVCVYILENNLLQDDMRVLYLSYNQQPSEIKKIIEANAKEHIDEIINSPSTVAPALKVYLLQADDVDFADKIDLVVALIPTLEKEDACRILAILSLNDYIKIFDSHSRPKFEANEQNKKLLDAFQNRGWIFDYTEDDTRAGYYKIRRREPRKSDKIE